MDLRLFNENYKVKFEKTQELETNGQTPVETDAEIKIVSPKEKSITTSISDILKTMETTGNVSTLPANINEGVQNFEYKNSEITTYRKGKTLKIQINGNTPLKEIKPKLVELIPIQDSPVQTTPSNTNGVNGEIDEKVSQGGTGDCWILSGVLALNSTEAGKQIIKETITSNPDGSATVTFKGIGVSYTISAAEIQKHDTDNILNDAYSNGDNDMLVLELAVAKLKKDIQSGKVKLDVPDDSWEGYNNGSIEGGFAQQMIYFLTGKTANTLVADNARAGGKEAQTFISEEDIFKTLQNALDNENTVLNFAIYDGVHSAKQTNGRTFSIDLGNGGHALAITNVTDTTVTFVNPWDSTKEYTMSWEEFAKLGIGMLSSTSLDEISKPENVDGIKQITPGVDGKIYSLNKLYAAGFSDNDIEKYFDCQLKGFIYTIKSDIKIPGIRGQQGETVKSLQDLMDISGVSSRNELKSQGLTDEVIDKYFILALNGGTGKANYIPNDFKHMRYNIKQEGNTVTLTFSGINSKSPSLIVVIEDGKITQEIDCENDTFAGILEEWQKACPNGWGTIEDLQKTIGFVDRLLNCKDLPEERRLEFQSFRKVCEQNIIRLQNYEKEGTDTSVQDIQDELNAFVKKFREEKDFGSDNDRQEYGLTYHNTCISFYERILQCKNATAEERTKAVRMIALHRRDADRIRIEKDLRIDINFDFSGGVTEASYKSLISMGFSNALIERYFDLPDKSINSQMYTLKKDIEVISGSGVYITSIDELVELLKKYGIIK